MKKPIFDSLAEALLKGFNCGDENESKAEQKPLKGKALPITESERGAGVTAKAKLGRSRSERIDRQFNSNKDAMSYMRQHKDQANFLQKVSGYLELAKSYLSAKQLPTELPLDKSDVFENLFDLLIAKIEYGGYGFDHDSFEALAARFIWHIEEMIDQELDQTARLEHAVAFGHVTTLWEHYHAMVKPQKENAKRPRDPLLSSIFSKLAGRKVASDLTSKELWPEFISALEDSIFTDDVNEKKRNLSNPETWSVTFCRLKGEEVSDPEEIQYKTFRDSLSRKIRASRG
jgi:hypothetical protein